MANSDLTADQVRKSFDYDPETGVMTGKRGKPIGAITKKGYLRIMVGHNSYMVHRLAWLWVHGAWPAGQIDHINGDPKDNRISNLRDVSAAVNVQNQRHPQRSNQLGVLGVRQFGGKFRATITVNGRWRHLGLFETPELAHAAYLAAKRELHPGCTI